MVVSVTGISTRDTFLLSMSKYDCGNAPAEVALEADAVAAPNRLNTEKCVVVQATVLRIVFTTQPVSSVHVLPSHL